MRLFNLVRMALVVSIVWIGTMSQAMALSPTNPAMAMSPAMTPTMALSPTMTPTMTPTMACADMAAAAMPAMTGDTEGSAPAGMAGCDMVCIACLVQPAPLRIGAISGWTAAVHYLLPALPFTALNVMPDLRPPRPVGA